MAALGDDVPIVQTEASGLAQFLDTLSTADWQRQSACDLWSIRDVVAHLIWAADFYTDTVSRGRQGDISMPEDRPPGNAPEPAAMPAYFDQQTRSLRDHLGARLMPTFRSIYRSLSDLMLSLSPQSTRVGHAVRILSALRRPPTRPDLSVSDDSRAGHPRMGYSFTIRRNRYPSRREPPALARAHS